MAAIARQLWAKCGLASASVRLPGDCLKTYGRYILIERALGVADAWGGVNVDHRGSTGDLGIGVGHPHRYHLLQSKHVAEIFRKILQQSQLRGAGVTEPGGQPVDAKQVDGCLPDANQVGPSFLARNAASYGRYIGKDRDEPI